MRPRVLAFALVLGACAPAPQYYVIQEGKALPLPAPRPLRYETVAETLSNGARVIAVQVPNAQRVTLTASYLQGRLAEPPGKEGTAALALRLCEEAMSGRGGLAVYERLFALGAIASTELRADDLEYRSIARPAGLEELVAIERDRAREPLAGLDEKDLERHRATLVAALELTTADPREGESLELAARLLEGSPHARRAPSPATLRAVLFEDVRSWLRSAFAPTGAVYFVTGPGDPRESVRLFAKHLGGGPAGAPSPPPAALAPAPRGGAVFEMHQVPSPSRRLWLAWALPGDASGAFAQVEGARMLLERRLDWVIARRYRGQVELEVRARRSPGATILAATMEFGPAVDARRLRLDLTDAALAVGVLQPDAPVASFVRTAFDEGFVAALDLNGIPDGARLHRVTGTPDPVAARRVLAGELGQRDLQAFYARHVTHAGLVAMLFEPSGPAAFRASDEVLGWRSGVDRLAVAAPGAGSVGGLVSGPELGRAATRRLANGLTVVALPTGGVPLAEVRLVVRPGVEPLSAAFVAPTYLADTLNRFGDSPAAGGCLSGRTALLGDALSQRALVSGGHLALGVSMVSCWTRRAPHFTPFENFKVEAARAAELEERSPVPRAIALLTEALYGLPFREPPVPANVKKLRDEDVGRWFRTSFRPDRAMLLVTGDVEPSVAFAEAERWTARWLPTGAPLVTPARPEPARRIVRVLDVPDSRLSLLLVGFRLPERRAADVAAELATAVALELAMLRATLPNGQVGASVGGLPDDPAVHGFAYVESSRAGETGAAILRSLDELAARPPSASDVDLVRWLTARNEAYRYDGVNGAADAAEQLFLQGLPLTAWDDLPAGLAAVDGARMQAVARRARGHEVLVIAGDAQRFLPALRKAGIELDVVKLAP